MKSFSFTVPIAPVGKERPRVTRRNGMVVTYTPKKTITAENAIRFMALANRLVRMEGPLKLDLICSMEPPASMSQKKRLALMEKPMEGYPDVDNLLKLVMDALQGLVYKNDKSVVQASVLKKYGERNSITVSIAQI